MKRDFLHWSKLKQIIDDSYKRRYYREREVWWCAFGLNIGFEMYGKGKYYSRPVLIIKGLSREVCLCIPLTTKQKIGKYYHDLRLEDKVVRKVVLSQIRLIDTKRLLQRMGTIEKEDFTRIKKALIQILE